MRFVKMFHLGGRRTIICLSQGGAN